MNLIRKKEQTVTVILDPDYVLNQPVFDAKANLLGSTMAHSLEGLALQMIALHAPQHNGAYPCCKVSFKDGKYRVDFFETLEEMNKHVFNKKDL